MQKNIIDINSDVYHFLNKQREEDPKLRFTLRKTNRNGRLEDGYWFYGNDSYLALSFWSGTDWKNKTPNIIFVILPNQTTYLEVNTSDSVIKREYIEKYLEEELQLKRAGKRFYKEYEKDDYIYSLNSFLNTDKKKIDKIIRSSASFFSTVNKEDRISFIDENDFLITKIKVEQFQHLSRNEFFSERNESLRSLSIQNYGPIKSIEINEIPAQSRWIFLTGENGTGKTSFLKALTSALTDRKLPPEELEDTNTFRVNLSLYSNRNNSVEISRNGNYNLKSNKLWIGGLAVYGAIRLTTNHLHSSITKKKLSTVYNLFNTDGILLDVLFKSTKWIKDFDPGFAERRLFSIREILQDIIPNLNKIIFEDKITLYLEEDKDGEVYERPVDFEKLASGIKSMIAMIGDMLCRLFDQQPEIDDASELIGIVIIDEIDIHLHPKLQRRIVEELDKSFRKIQFIVSTHSPIPLLGAPRGSLIFKIDRNPDDGVVMTRLDQIINLEDLLPNTILTSPIFGFDDLIPKSHSEENFIRTENTYNDIQFNDRLKNEINEFITDVKEQELIKLFKQRRSE